LLALGVVLEPAPDGGDRPVLGVGGRDVGHAASPSETR
jgi:hypothetical protein